MEFESTDRKSYNKSNSKINGIEIANLLVGTKLKEYFELVEEIKSGGGGSVYKAKFTTIKTSKYAALKIISFKRNNNIREESNKLKKFKKSYKEKHSEILIHYKLKSRYIPDVYGYYSINNWGSCIAMEHSSFGDLSNFRKNVLKKYIFSETLLCYISWQVLNAISYLHKNKIIHMDIKTQNILINDYLEIKLADFSVSLDYKSCQETVCLLNNGTTHFKSPEVLEEREIDVKDASKVDIFSLGIVLYYLSSCDFPYETKYVTDDKQILKNIKEKKLNLEGTKNSEMFKNFLKKCLEKDLNKRYYIEEALKDPWIKGNYFILNEKEKLNNAGKFLINMSVDNIIDFNEYVNGKVKNI